MSIEQINKIKKIQKTSATNPTSNGVNSPYNGLNNMSVFDYAKKHPKAPSNSDNANIAKGNESKADADDKTRGASGWTKEIKRLNPDITARTKAANTFGNTTRQKGQNIITAMQNDANTINGLNGENDLITAELGTLIDQRERISADDGTGAGANSAYSLDFGGTDTTNPFQPKDEQPASTEINDINSRIETLTGKQASITTTIKTKANSYKKNSASLSSLKTQALNKAKAARAAAAEAAKKAETAQKIGTVTTTIGAATTLVGMALASGIFTAPSAPPVVASGATATTAGTGAVSAAGNLLGITANLGTTAGKVQAVGQFLSYAGSGYSKLNTKTKTA